MKSEKLTANELMDILGSQLRSLSGTNVNDKNIGKTIAKSKEISNLSGKAISLASLQFEVALAGGDADIALLGVKGSQLKKKK